MFLKWLQSLMRGSQPSPMPLVGQFSPKGDFNKAKHDEAIRRWEFEEQMRQRKQERFAAMAGDPGDVPREWTSRAGKMEAGDPLTPVQVAGGPAPSDPMARYGRPKKWPYLQSIVNMGRVA